MVTPRDDLSTPARILAATEQALLLSDSGSLRVDGVARAAQANKRMIYHYFGDRTGLLQAVYALQIQRLLAPHAHISDATRRVLQRMLKQDVSIVVESSGELLGLDEGPAMVQQAARILLPYLLNVPAEDGSMSTAEEVTAVHWVSFCVEVMSLAMAASAPLRFPEEPGTEAFVRVSERLLTQPKSRLRLTPDSRPR